MSDNKKKALLNETTTRRFWKLAGLQPIHEKAYVFEEEQEIEEATEEVEEEMDRSKEDDKEEVEEGMDRAKEDDKEEVDENMDRPAPGGIKGVYSHKFKDEDEYAPKTVKVGDKGSTITTAKARKMNEEDLEEEVEDIEEMGMDRAAEDEPEMDMGAEEGPEDGQDVEVDVPEGDVASLRTARDILDQILSAVDGADEEPEMDAEEPAMDDEEPALEEGDDEELNEVDQEELEEVAERIAARVAKRIAESLKRK